MSPASELIAEETRESQFHSELLVKKTAKKTIPAFPFLANKMYFRYHTNV